MNNKTLEKQASEAGVDANGHASSLYALGYSESADKRRQTAVHEAQGMALFQIREFVQVGFLYQSRKPQRTPLTASGEKRSSSNRLRPARGH
jgi:hypothetical protein